MLTHPAPEARRARPQLSLRQEYEEFILQRIEDFKDQLPRPQLLALADEAVHELEVGPSGQMVLTEVLVLEHVDRLIMRRLKLPTYRRWRERHMRLRQAQREPSHWGLSSESPLSVLGRRLEASDLALVVGSDAAPAGFFLAACDVDVLAIDNDLQAVEAIEARTAAEGLSARLQALVVHLGHWLPDVRPAVVVLDPVRLAALDATSRANVMEGLRACTVRGGVHCVLVAERRGVVRSLAPEALQSYYGDWIVERARGRRPGWILATKP